MIYMNRNFNLYIVKHKVDYMSFIVFFHYVLSIMFFPLCSFHYVLFIMFLLYRSDHLYAECENKIFKGVNVTETTSLKDRVY